MASPYDALLAATAGPAKVASPYDALLAATGTAPQEKSLIQALFPAATGQNSATQVEAPLSFGFGQSGNVGGANIRGAQDLTSLLTRAAGSAAGQAGYAGAIGGAKSFKEGMADPETGIARPIRQAYSKRIQEQIAGLKDPNRSILQKAGNAAGLGLDALGYAGASVIEDPTVLVGGAARPIAAGAAKVGETGVDLAKLANKLGGRFAEEASGVPEEALRAYGTAAGRKAIQQNAGKEYQIGQDLVDKLNNFDHYTPEREAINDILKRMPGISPKNTIKALEDSKTATTLAPGKQAVYETTHPKLDIGDASTIGPDVPGQAARNRTFDAPVGDAETKLKVAGEPGKSLADIPSGDAANKKIDDLVGRLRLIAGEDVHTGEMGKIPADKFRNIRTSYDTEAKAAFKKDDRELIEKALVNARGQMAADLRQSAVESGNPEFVSQMASYSDKLDKLERIKKFLGSNADTRESRAEGFVANLMNQNKTSQQNLIKDLEDVFDTDLTARIQGAKYAKQIGKDGAPALLPKQFTGRANLAQTMFGAASIPFSSPAMASRVTLPLLQKLASAKMPAEAAFYVSKLKQLGLTAAQIDVLKSSPEVAQASNIIPFRRVADNTPADNTMARNQ